MSLEDIYELIKKLSDTDGNIIEVVQFQRKRIEQLEHEMRGVKNDLMELRLYGKIEKK